MDSPCTLTSQSPRSLRIAGELDISTVSGVVEALGRLDAHDDVYLNLRDLTFMDSAGVHVLVHAARLVKPSRLVLVAPTRQVQRVLDLSGVVDSMGNLQIVHPTPASGNRLNGTRT
jgi:anti-anti-sigma factor